MLIKETLILIPFLGRRKRRRKEKIFFLLFNINGSEAFFLLFLLFDLLHLKNMLSFK